MVKGSTSSVVGMEIDRHFNGEGLNNLTTLVVDGIIDISEKQGPTSSGSSRATNGHSRNVRHSVHCGRYLGL